MAARCLVAHEAGLARAALEGALGPGREGSELGLPATSHPPPVSRSFPAPTVPYPRIDAHGVGDAVMLSGLTLVNVRANLDGRERRGHRPRAETPHTSHPVHVSSASYLSPTYIPPPTSTILMRTLPPSIPRAPGPGLHPFPLKPGRKIAARLADHFPDEAHPSTALTCLLALAKASPTPSWAGPLNPGGQASQRKPGLVLTQRTRGKQGCALHWGRKGHGGSEDAGGEPRRERRLKILGA